MLHIEPRAHVGTVVWKPHISTIVDRIGTHLLPAECEKAEENYSEQVQEVHSNRDRRILEENGGISGLFGGLQRVVPKQL